jgi:arylsulfatase G
MHKPIGHDPRWTNVTGFGVYADAMYELDYHIGRVMQALEDNGVANDTLVFITGDNGPATYECQFGGQVGPLLGQWQSNHGQGGGHAKGTNWEGGIREVSLAYWPGQIKPRVTNALTTTLDYMTTLAALSGATLPTDRVYDGIDLSPILFDGLDQGHKTLYHPNSNTGSHGEITALRVGKYKAHYVTGQGWFNCSQIKAKVLVHTPPLIFDLNTDIAEKKPLQKSDPGYDNILGAVRQAYKDYENSLVHDKISTVDWSNDPNVKPCCNPSHPVCRCTCEQDEL